MKPSPGSRGTARAPAASQLRLRVPNRVVFKVQGEVADLECVDCSQHLEYWCGWTGTLRVWASAVGSVGGLFTTTLICIFYWLFEQLSWYTNFKDKLKKNKAACALWKLTWPTLLRFYSFSLTFLSLIFSPLSPFLVLFLFSVCLFWKRCQRCCFYTKRLLLSDGWRQPQLQRRACVWLAAEGRSHWKGQN